MKKSRFTLIKYCILSTSTMLLSACSLFEKDNTPAMTPLHGIQNETKPHMIWATRVNSGMNNDYLKFVPALANDKLFTADNQGIVTATDKNTGKTLWQKSTQRFLSAGPSAGDNIVVVGTNFGSVIALSQENGSKLWESVVDNEILAPPTVSENLVLVKTIGGQVSALSSTDGEVKWRYNQAEPNMILRGGSAPQIHGNSVIVGFANGNLSKLNKRDGSLDWQETIAIPTGSFAIQRMIDIDANPYIYRNTVYAATYQGKISLHELSSGKELWNHDISSFTGLTADSDKAYISDADSYLWAFDNNTGNVSWRQNQLLHRNISGPADVGNNIVVGDGEGYLHWLSKQDGHFIARIRVGGHGIVATPLVNDNVVYVLTKDGHLAAYTLASRENK